MSNLFPIQNNPEFKSYYKSEDLENTDFANYEYQNFRRPDALIGFTNDVFLYPQTVFFNIEEDGDLSLYD